MIQANELRVGNKLGFYVPDLYELQVLTVTGVGKDEEGIYWVYSDDYATINIENGVRPIQLTPSILEQSGFKKIDPDYCFDGFCISYINGVFKYTTMVDGGIVFQYVHQLQNLYFVVNSKEIDIKL
jgi:hypothetical protein